MNRQTTRFSRLKADSPHFWGYAYLQMDAHPFRKPEVGLTDKA